jgi:hypothetical protein
MSEPLTSHEIEDVLSSIRRLVSEELRPTARAAAAAQPSPPPAAAEAGKLLLTPALRVVPDTPAEAEPAPAGGDEPPEGILTPLAAGPEYDDEGWNRADETVSTALVDPVEEPAVETEVISAAEPTWPEPQTEVWPDGTEVLWSSVGSTMDAPEEEAEPPAGAAPAADGPGHWSAQDVPGVDWVQEGGDWVEPEPMPFVAHPRKAALADDPLARAWADRAEAEVRASLHGTPPPAQPQPAPAAAEEGPRLQPAVEEPGLFDGDGPEIDEEVLRDIVRDIIREELAGTLGERITRNVRKLVRVEINRALTAREFE